MGLKAALTDDVVDERKGAKTYAVRAKQLDRADRPRDAHTVRGIRHDELRHGKLIRSIRSR